MLDKNLPLQNISYRKITVYNTEEINPLINEKYHAAVFFSPSGVRSFAKHNSLENLKLFSIGETTEKELKKIEDIFRTSIEFEFLFWDMAYRMKMSY